MPTPALRVALFEACGAMVSTQMVARGSEHWIGVSSGVASAIGRSKGLPIKSLSVLYRKTPSVIFSRAERGIDLSQAMAVIVRQLGHQPLGQQTRQGWQATCRRREGRPSATASP